jgi:hypothetical protein
MVHLHAARRHWKVGAFFCFAGIPWQLIASAQDLRLDQQTRAFANLICPVRGAERRFWIQDELERLPMVPTQAFQGKC